MGSLSLWSVKDNKVREANYNSTERTHKIKKRTKRGSITMDDFIVAVTLKSGMYLTIADISNVVLNLWKFSVVLLHILLFENVLQTPRMRTTIFERSLSPYSPI